jgi:hypothetical protein
VRYGFDSSGITESVEGCEEWVWNCEPEVTGRRLSDVGNGEGERTTRHAPGPMPRVHQRSHRMRVMRLSMNVTNIRQSQGVQVETWPPTHVFVESKGANQVLASRVLEACGFSSAA